MSDVAPFDNKAIDRPQRKVHRSEVATQLDDVLLAPIDQHKQLSE
jgi:hypothetical protein